MLDLLADTIGLEQAGCGRMLLAGRGLVLLRDWCWWAFGWWLMMSNQYGACDVDGVVIDEGENFVENIFLGVFFYDIEIEER